jgi:hypothetical protein
MKNKKTKEREFVLTEEDVKNRPTEPLEPTLTSEEIKESKEKYQKFIDSIKKEIKKGLK